MYRRELEELHLILIDFNYRPIGIKPISTTFPTYPASRPYTPFFHYILFPKNPISPTRQTIAYFLAYGGVGGCFLTPTLERTDLTRKTIESISAIRSNIPATPIIKYPAIDIW